MSLNYGRTLVNFTRDWFHFSFYRWGNWGPKKGRGRSHKTKKEENILVPYFFHISHILNRKKQTLFLDVTIQHYFPSVCLLSKWQLSKKTEDSEAKGRYQDLICLVFQCKTKESHSNGHPITRISSDLILRSFSESVMQSESQVTTVMEEALLENLYPFRKIRNMHRIF